MKSKIKIIHVNWIHLPAYWQLYDKQFSDYFYTEIRRQKKIL